jgi:hypothetical protein
MPEEVQVFEWIVIGDCIFICLPFSRCWLVEGVKMGWAWQQVGPVREYPGVF